MQKRECRNGPETILSHRSREQGIDRDSRSFGGEGKGNQLDMLVRLAGAGLGTTVVESQSAVFGHAEPERLEVL